MDMIHLEMLDINQAGSVLKDGILSTHRQTSQRSDQEQKQQKQQQQQHQEQPGWNGLHPRIYQSGMLPE